MLGYKLFVLFFATGFHCRDAEIHTIHFAPKTWNEARDICAQNGGHLLQISTEDEWTMWITIINFTVDPQTPTSFTYWFGLHAVDNITDNSSIHVWDPCEAMHYSKPLVADLPFDYACVLMWIHREVSPGQFTDNWYEGRRCDLTYPFICTHKETDLSCVPSCSLTILSVDEMNCKDWCLNESCVSQYINKTSTCYVQHSVDANMATYTVCMEPNINSTNSSCSDLSAYSVNYTDFIDTNVGISESACPNASTTAHNSSTTSMSTTTTTTTTDSITENETPTDSPPKQQTCICSCKELWMFQTEPDTEVVNLTVEEKVEIIVAELTLDKKNTTISQRRYISVMDDRASSVGIGVIAVGIIVTTFCIIVMIDLSRMWHEISDVLMKIRNVIKGNKVGQGEPLTKAD